MFDPGRFEGNKGEAQAETIPEAPLTETELRAREQELKARYEDPYRNEQAKRLWDERKSIREKEEKRIVQLQSFLSQNESSTKQASEVDQVAYKETDTRLNREMEQLAVDEEVLKKKQENRSFFQKVKYRLFEDPLKKEFSALETKRGEYQAALDENDNAKKAVQQKWDSYMTEKNANLQERIEETKQKAVESKKDLLEKVHTINKASREAIRNTHEATEKGELDVSNLARETNAIVVHGIPLDGWHMANTSMNNKEVNTEGMTAKEKADILIERQPDVSASILSVDRIDGQNMFYPFAYILDGKMVAAYDTDEGTIADGTSRRRKEEYLNATLQKNVKEEFKRVAHSPARINPTGGQYNESIVYQPTLKGVLLDEVVLDAAKEKGDEVREVFSSREEEEEKMAAYVKQYGDSIVDSSQWMRNELGVEPKTLFMRRKRTAMQKAVEYAREHHPELPIFLRKKDGIYTLDNKKVTANDIYS